MEIKEREDYLTIEGFADITPKVLPTDREIQELRKIKEIRKTQFLENNDFDFTNPEYKLAKLIEQRIPRGKKTDRLKLVIKKIKELQEKQGITEFTRDFLNSILKSYSKIEDRKRQLILKEILSKAKKRQGIIFKSYYIEQNKGIKRDGIIFQGCQERTIIKKPKEVNFYSFL